MKKIAIVANDVAMPGEKGLSRLHYLAEFLVKNGFDVEIITADFQHWSKRYRTAEEQENAKKNSACRLTFIHELPYSKNIDPRRILSYRLLARNVKKYLRANQYDLIYALVPDNHVAATAGKYAKQNGIGFIVDVEDLWPEAMRMAFDVPVVSDIFFSYYEVSAKKAYSLADGVVGSSEEYRRESEKYGIDIKDGVTVYVGNELATFDEGVRTNAASIDKPEGEFWITYAGSLGTSYDIHTMIKAGEILKRRGYDNIRIMLLGDGPLRADFEATAAGCDANVTFAGYQSYDKMAAYLAKSDITVNSLVSKASQSIVSKIGDYLAAAKPMINTGLNPEFCKKVETDGFGVNVVPEDPEAFADAAEALYKDAELRARMSAAAREKAESEFNRPVSYMRIVELVNRHC